LKNNKTVYIDGQEKIGKSFVATKPRAAAVSKRLLVDAPNRGSGAEAAAAASPPAAITFCLDLHRAECSPGLGDVSKGTALLYRCDRQRITRVWGMTDAEGLAADTALTLPGLLASNAWALAAGIIAEDVDIGSLDGSCSEQGYHYHNYDNIELWG
jgi:hypothetical protein